MSAFLSQTLPSQISHPLDLENFLKPLQMNWTELSGVNAMVSVGRWQMFNCRMDKPLPVLCVKISLLRCSRLAIKSKMKNPQAIRRLLLMFTSSSFGHGSKGGLWPCRLIRMLAPAWIFLVPPRLLQLTLMLISQWRWHLTALGPEYLRSHLSNIEHRFLQR